MRRTTRIAPRFAVCLLVGITGVWAAEDGKALYDAKCAICHSKNGVAKPMAKGSPNLNDPKWQEATTLEAIEQRITDGKALMKPFKDKLTPEQIKAVADYVKTLK